MPLPRTYTERIGVYMRGEHRAELQRALPREVGVGAALRDAGLRAIGRSDLVLESKREEGGNRRPRKSAAENVTVAVWLTEEQRMELQSAAKDMGLSLTLMLHEALREELGLTPLRARDSRGGWVMGTRRSRRPPR